VLDAVQRAADAAGRRSTSSWAIWREPMFRTRSANGRRPRPTSASPSPRVFGSAVKDVKADADRMAEILDALNGAVQRGGGSTDTATMRGSASPRRSSLGRPMTAAQEQRLLDYIRGLNQVPAAADAAGTAIDG
jgi:hypothetical protein